VLLDGAVCSLQLGGLLWFALHGSLDLLRIYLVIGASCAIAALAAFALKALPVRISQVRVASDWRQNWGFSKWTLGSLLLANTTPLLLMPWLLALTHGEASTGILAACGSLVGLANTFLIGIDNVLGPKSAHSYARGGLSDLWRIARNCTLLLAGVLGVFCLALFIADDWLSVTVYGQQYEGTGLVVRLLGLNIFMAAMGLAPGNALWAMERPAGNFRASAVDVAVTLIIAAALVVPFGVVGAAAATLAGTSAGTVARWAMFVRASRLASPAIATT
jgi:O-antigen/teichoic acid export membrane protein